MGTEGRGDGCPGQRRALVRQRRQLSTTVTLTAAASPHL